jgi:hypothetical protein
MDVREAWEQHSGHMMLKLSPYPEAQHRHLARFQGRGPTVLEIGVNWGGSLRLWRRYFGETSTIVGIDINPACAGLGGDGMHVRIGDQTDRTFLEAVAEEYGPFDVVIDDGGHTMEQQITSFEVLYPHVATTGVYVCEDSFSSYVDEFGGRRAGTFMDVAKSRIDEMHAWFNPDQPPTDFTRTATSMHFYLGLVIIEKGEVTAPQLMLCGDDGVFYEPLDSVVHR